METNHPGVARVFFDKWFALINESKGLPRVHDKKLSIAAICALLDLDPASVPATLKDGWAGMVKAALLVFADLPRAIEGLFGFYVGVLLFCLVLMKNCFIATILRPFSEEGP